MKNIFVIDDDKPILEVTKIILEDYGYKVTVLDNIKGASKLLKKQTPDLVLLDISINGQNGCDFAEKLRTGQATKQIPVIIFSADNKIKKLAQKVGVDFLAKPFDINDLIVKVNKYVK